MKFNFNGSELDKITDIRNSVDKYSKNMDDIVDAIVKPYSKDLDNYVIFIRDCLKDGENPPTNDELDDFCLNLSTLIYFAGCMCEQLGIRDDISKSVWRDMFNNKRSELEKGTIADKDAYAEMESQHEEIVSICYNRAYKIMKAKVGNAQELLQSCKKVLSRRMQETELTRIGGSN